MNKCKTYSRYSDYRGSGGTGRNADEIWKKQSVVIQHVVYIGQMLFKLNIISIFSNRTL